MKYCAYCGTGMNDDAAFCVKCGAPAVKPAAPDPASAPTPTSIPQPGNYTYPNNGYNYPNNNYPYQNNYAQASPNNAPKSQAAMVLGILGIVFAWLFALVGHVVSIIGIVLGSKEYKETGRTTGLVLSIIGEICSLLSSLIGAIICSSYIIY